MKADRAQVKANVLVQLLGPDGAERARREVHNTVPTAGIQAVADQLLASPTMIKPGWMELGTGTGGTTKLNTVLTGTRVALTSKTRGSNAIITMIGDWAAGVGTGTITEAGIFSVVTEDAVDSTHPMYAYSSFTGIVKGADDTLKITWTLTLS